MTDGSDTEDGIGVHTSGGFRRCFQHGIVECNVCWRTDGAYEIGFICRKGGSHVVFYADPESGGCDSKSIATITINFGNYVGDREAIVNNANEEIRKTFEKAYGQDRPGDEG